MAEAKCTESGSKLWSWVTTFTLSVLIVEELFLKSVLEQNPAIEKSVQLIGSVIALSTVAGLIMLHQALTSKTFEMSMRVGLAISGSLVSSGAVLGGLILISTRF